jgi:hypothetical protein
VPDPVPPPPPAPPAGSPPDYSGPPDASGLPEYARPAPGGWLRLVLGLALTAALLVGVVLAWPDGGDDEAGTDSTPRSPTTLVEPPFAPGVVPSPPIGSGGEDVDLFSQGAPLALAQLLAAAGDPSQLYEIAVYPTYLIVAYRDPVEPSHIDRRIWRAGAVDAAAANPIDDRVEAGTEPGLFGSGEVDLARLAGMTADARTRYSVPVDVSHVLIDRFLPFDERVLVRVYATPSDGRSGGGYVTYTPDGSFVDVCC